MKVAERRMPGAEVVDMEMYPHFSQLAHRLNSSIDVFHDHALRDFQCQCVRINTGLRHKTGKLADEVLLSELFARNIDAHGERRSHRIPHLKQFQLPTGFVKYPFSDMIDEPGLFSQGDELHWVDEAALWMIPADERFESDQPLRIEVDDRLIVENELLVVGRSPQIGL